MHRLLAALSCRHLPHSRLQGGPYLKAMLVASLLATTSALSAATSGTARSTDAFTSPFPDTLARFSNACPALVRPYLLQALLDAQQPNASLPQAHVDAVCDCIVQRLEEDGPATAGQPAAIDAAGATTELRACVAHTLSAHNRDWAEQQHLPYLMGQRWDDGQISRFSLCLANEHWRQMEGAVLGQAPARIDPQAAWLQCATHVGRADTPMPPASAPGTAPALSPAAPR